MSSPLPLHWLRQGWGQLHSVTTVLPPPTSNAAKYWRKERGSWGASSSKTFPPGPSPPYCFREYCLFTDANTVETREKQVEGVPPPPKASFIPPTLTQLPLWCKNKQKTSKQTKNVVSLGMDGERKRATPHFPRAGRRNTFMEGRQWQNPALILHSEQ